MVLINVVLVAVTRQEPSQGLKYIEMWQFATADAREIGIGELVLSCAGILKSFLHGQCRCGQSSTAVPKQPLQPLYRERSLTLYERPGCWCSTATARTHKTSSFLEGFSAIFCSLESHTWCILMLSHCSWFRSESFRKLSDLRKRTRAALQPLADTWRHQVFLIPRLKGQGKWSNFRVEQNHIK